MPQKRNLLSFWGWAQTPDDGVESTITICKPVILFSQKLTYNVLYGKEILSLYVQRLSFLDTAKKRYCTNHS